MQLEKLRMDWRAVVAIVATTLLLTVDHYHVFFTGRLQSIMAAQVATRTLLYLVVPLLLIVLVFRESPARYGLQIGDWKAGLLLTGAGCAGMALVMAVVARTPDFQRYYGGAVRSDVPFWLAYGIELFGWEFFFRGFLLFALYRACGPLALVLQAVPFALAHLGKPELETLSCIFGGTAFGYVAWRTRSSLYPFLIHWFMVVLTELLAAGVI